MDAVVVVTELVALTVGLSECVPAFPPVFPCGLDGELHALNRMNKTQTKNVDKNDEWGEEYFCNVVFSDESDKLSCLE